MRLWPVMAPLHHLLWSAVIGSSNGVDVVHPWLGHHTTKNMFRARPRARPRDREVRKVREVHKVHEVREAAEPAYRNRDNRETGPARGPGPGSATMLATVTQKQHKVIKHIIKQNKNSQTSTNNK